MAGSLSATTDIRTRQTNADLADAVDVDDRKRSAVVLAAFAQPRGELRDGLAERRRTNESPSRRHSHAREGRRSCHSVARSYACANDRTVDSAKWFPLICSPIGSPEEENPHGTVIVGSP